MAKHLWLVIICENLEGFPPQKFIVYSILTNKLATYLPSCIITKAQIVYTIAT